MFTLVLSSPILTFLQSVSLATRTGLLWSLAHGGRTLFSDRFQLGGPTSVRSFKTSGMGPRDGRKYSSIPNPCQSIGFSFCKADSVGGELYYSAGASFISDVPTKAHWPLKAHLWVNAGRLDSVNQGRTVLNFVLLLTTLDEQMRP